MVLPELTGDIASMAGSSPRGIAAIAILRIYEKYFDQMATNADFNVERGTAALIICCPETTQRARIWKVFLDERKTQGEVTASVLAVGEWYSYMSDAMGLTEKSTGGY